MSAVLAETGDERVLTALRSGDERVFTELVGAWSPSMLRLATSITGNRSVGEEVVQETWIAVLRSIGRFEARASLKTWVFRILANTAKTRAARERRSVPFSALADDALEPAAAPDRFLGPESRHPGHWASVPDRWHERPEARLATAETLEVVAQAIAALPPGQRTVISLRDVEGWTSEEVCEALGLSDVNQRVLLHRARSKVRQALEDELSRCPGRV